MTPVAAPVVDWATLGEVVLYSLASGVGVAICFSLAIVGAARFTDNRREGGPGIAAIAYGALATLGLAATLAAVVIGIVVMTSKS
jgi:hypothetical protein